MALLRLNSSHWHSLPAQSRGHGTTIAQSAQVLEMSGRSGSPIQKGGGGRRAVLIGKPARAVRLGARVGRRASSRGWRTPPRLPRRFPWRGPSPRRFDRRRLGPGVLAGYVPVVGLAAPGARAAAGDARRRVQGGAVDAGLSTRNQPADHDLPPPTGTPRRPDAAAIRGVQRSRGLSASLIPALRTPPGPEISPRVPRQGRSTQGQLAMQGSCCGIYITSVGPNRASAFASRRHPDGLRAATSSSRVCV
jgi:hypothetical protein